MKLTMTAWPSGESPSDADLDEGAIWEAVADPSVAKMGELLWIVDRNRQSLDRVVPDIQTERLQGMFAAAGCEVITLKRGRTISAMFRQPGGADLRARLESMLQRGVSAPAACPRAAPQPTDSPTSATHDTPPRTTRPTPHQAHQPTRTDTTARKTFPPTPSVRPTDPHIRTRIGYHRQMVKQGRTKVADTGQVAANLLKLARLEKGLSQRALATAATVPHSTVARIESGAMQPTLPLLYRLLAAADLEPRIRLEPYDDHDDTLDALAENFPDRQHQMETAHKDMLTALQRSTPHAG